eukprot:scaffold871_cov340-Prasinococcus_capsulatus_cf.AAC.2
MASDVFVAGWLGDARKYKRLDEKQKARQSEGALAPSGNGAAAAPPVPASDKPPRPKYREPGDDPLEDLEEDEPAEEPPPTAAPPTAAEAAQANTETLKLHNFRHTENENDLTLARRTLRCVARQGGMRPLEGVLGSHHLSVSLSMRAHWRHRVDSCASLAELAILVRTLEDAILWEAVRAPTDEPEVISDKRQLPSGELEYLVHTRRVVTPLPARLPLSLQLPSIASTNIISTMPPAAAGVSATGALVSAAPPGPVEVNTPSVWRPARPAPAPAGEPPASAGVRPGAQYPGLQTGAARGRQGPRQRRGGATGHGAGRQVHPRGSREWWRRWKRRRWRRRAPLPEHAGHATNGAPRRGQLRLKTPGCGQQAARADADHAAVAAWRPPAALAGLVHAEPRRRGQHPRRQPAAQGQGWPPAQADAAHPQGTYGDDGPVFECDGRDRRQPQDARDTAAAAPWQGLDAPQGVQAPAGAAAAPAGACGRHRCAHAAGAPGRGHQGRRGRRRARRSLAEQEEGQAHEEARRRWRRGGRGRRGGRLRRLERRQQR